MSLFGLWLGCAPSKLGQELDTTTNETSTSFSETVLDTNATSESGSDDSTSPPSSDPSGDEDSNSETSESCPLPTFEDDLVLRYDLATALPNDAYHLVSTQNYAIVCGRGYLASVPFDGGAAKVLNDTSFNSQCTALAWDGDKRGLLATESGRIILFRIKDMGELAIVDQLRLSQGPPELLDHVFDIWITPDPTTNTTTSQNSSLKNNPKSGTKSPPSSEQRLGYLATGTSGVFRFKIENDKVIVGEELPGSEDARGVIETEYGVVVADGSHGIRLLDLAGSGVLDQSPVKAGFALSVIAQDDRIVVGRGAWGLEVFDLKDGNFELIGQQQPLGSISNIMFHHDDLVANSIFELIRLRWNQGGSLETVSTETRPQGSPLNRHWFRVLAGQSNASPSISATVALTRDSVVPLAIGSGQAGPRIAVDYNTQSFSGKPGVVVRGEIFAQNIGHEDLVLAGLEASETLTAQFVLEGLQDRPNCPGQYIVPPGDEFVIEVLAEVSEASRVEDLLILSNDPTEPRYHLQVEFNRTPLANGDLAPDFVLYSTQGQFFRLSDQRGKILFFKPFNIT